MYQPPAGDTIAVALFEWKQTFMYAIWSQVLKTAVGRTLVCEAESSHDAQDVYKRLKEDALQLTTARTQSFKIMQYLTSTKIICDHWRGTCEAFILHFCKQMDDYQQS